MDSSVLGRLRGRSSTDVDRGPPEDEWFIPYKPAPTSRPFPSGIGSSPAPVRQPTLNILNVFSSSSSSPSEVDRNYRFPRSQPPNPAVGMQRLLPQRSAIYRSPSHSSLLESAPMSAGLPSSSSVPTGLAAPKVLFSPLSREIRAGSSSQPAFHDTYHPRQRTVSMPKPTQSRTVDGRHQNQHRRWAVPTMCDMFVLPRPHITPHTITPPDSPDEKSVDNDRVIEEGRARQQERDDWAEYLKRRGRSMSFGAQTADPNAPFVGSVRARSRSRENSRTSDLRGSSSRNGSFASRWSSRRGSGGRRGSLPVSRRENQSSFLNVDPSHGENVKSFAFVSGRRGSTGQPIGTTAASRSLGDLDNTLHPRRMSEQAAYRRGHTRNRSNPEEITSTEAWHGRHDGPSRTLRIQPAPPINRGGVVVIGAEPSSVDFRDSVRNESTANYRRRAPPSLDLSKPLPNLPPGRNATTLTLNRSGHVSQEVGIALSPDPIATPTTAPITATPTFPHQLNSPYSITSDITSSNARAVLAKQHQRSITKRAFQSPAHGPSSYRQRSSQETPYSATSSTFPPDAEITTPTASSSNVSTTRRKTAMEEAIGRSRAASVGAIEQSEPNQARLTLRTRPRTADTPDNSSGSISTLTRLQAATPSPVSPSFVPSPQLVYPITTEMPTPRVTYHFGSDTSLAFPDDQQLERRRTDSPIPEGRPSSSSAFLQVSRPNVQHVDSFASAKTTFTDASEGWDRSVGATSTPRAQVKELDEEGPSPDPAVSERDFHGLFFRTPRDAKGSPIASTSRFDPLTFPEVSPKKQHDQPVGLGYDLEAEARRRPSSIEHSDESTIELATPVLFSKDGQVASPYLGYVDPSSLGSASLQDQRTSPARLLASYRTMRPISQVSASGSEQDVGSDRGISHSPSSHCGRMQVSSPVHTPTPSATAPANRNSGELRDRSYLHSDAMFSNPLATNSTAPSPNLPVNASSSTNKRHSGVPSLIHDFPSPPTDTSPKMTTATASPARKEKHASAFGQVVTGPPGAGKTTYAHGMHQFLTALNRPVHIVNLDPAVSNPPYPCAISITDLITLDSVMDEYGLGPNGAILYCVEYLEANFDWLVEKLDALLEGSGGDGYVIFDTPGQVELWTNHNSLKRIVERLTKMDYRLAAVHLSDAHYITDASKFISVVLLALRAMMQLEMPHVNVLSKIDLLSTYGELPFDLRYYTECQDLSYLLSNLEKEPQAGKFGALNRAMVGLVEDFGLVGFETLAVEDKTSMMKLLRVLDRVTGYVFVPDSTSTHAANTHALFSSAMGLSDRDLGDVDDVQERWLDRKGEYDELETEAWRKEGEMRAQAKADDGESVEEQ